VIAYDARGHGSSSPAPGAADYDYVNLAADLGELLGRSPSAASRIATGLEQRGLLRRTEEVADRRQRLLTLTPQGGTLLAVFDPARADQFLAVVRPLPMADRAMVAMAVTALASRAMTRGGRLIKAGTRS